MTPRAGVKTTPALRRAFRGPRSQAGAPVFSSPPPGEGSVLPRLRRAEFPLADLTGYRDPCRPENMDQLSGTQSGGVVFKRQVVLLFVDVKTAEAVSVREFAEAAELFETEWRLKFVGDFEQRHTWGL